MEIIGSKYNCSSCVVCSALLRQYEFGNSSARQDHALHFDAQAFVTAVVGLNPEEFTGGLFVQEGEDVASRSFIDLQKGDVVFHQYDLRHGVDVKSGKRQSAIFWIKDSFASCDDQTTPWYFKPALAGDADAQANLGRMYRRGSGGVVQDAEESVRWYKKAAEQGHALAAYHVARHFQKKQDLNLASEWAHRAANHGHAGAQVLLGALLESQGGSSSPSKMHDVADWYRRSAMQEHPWGMYNYGRLFLQGEGGLQRNLREAHLWLTLAAERGYRPSAQLLGKLFEASDSPKDREQAVKWYRAAAGQGDAHAALSLARLLGSSSDKGHADEAHSWYHRAVARGFAEALPNTNNAAGARELITKAERALARLPRGAEL
eukprot:TRINITY_DN14420_c0_g1_i3.p1 TRINITY_DN14420_c0_g1~~TRINITY_DN14420_c0_g1_i3.p1  ORF type:complete len:376 (-),score=71.00 TRINITY_DN14420_c0_g1_i3:36-1163(-)